MSDRPTHLPDFKRPPVTEVAIGVQFNSIPGFLTPHVGQFWQAIETEFPETEEHPPISPVFETFGQNPQVMGSVDFGIPNFFGMPRSFFLNRGRTQLLQIQRDRFLHNWRKIGDEDTYPRFERILATFDEGLARLCAFVSEHKLGMVEPNQCEIAYINQIPLRIGETAFDGFVRLFGAVIAAPIVRDLGAPDDARLLLRYLLRNDKGAPIGRLIISAEPARRMDGANIIQLSLTARGAPAHPTTVAVSKFLSLGREHIVNGFTDITSPAMHHEWERQQ